MGKVISACSEGPQSKPSSSNVYGNSFKVKRISTQSKGAQDQRQQEWDRILDSRLTNYMSFEKKLGPHDTSPIGHKDKVELQQ